MSVKIRSLQEKEIPKNGIFKINRKIKRRRLETVKSFDNHE